MAQSSMPWDYEFPYGDAASEPYSAYEWEERYRVLFGSIFNSGIIAGCDDELEVTSGAGHVHVYTGAALVYGKLYRNTAQEELSIPTPVVATRWDYIILRSCWLSSGICAGTLHPGSGEVCGPKKIRACLKQGVEGGGLPIITQTPQNVYEIPLAAIETTTGGAITIYDRRTFLYNSPDADIFIPSGEMGEATTPADWEQAWGTWAFDHTLDEGVLLWTRIPKAWRKQEFGMYLHWTGLAAPGGNDQVVWQVTCTWGRPGITITENMPADRYGEYAPLGGYAELSGEDILMRTPLEFSGGDREVTDTAIRNDIMWIEIRRQGFSSVNDNYAADAQLIGIELRYR